MVRKLSVLMMYVLSMMLPLSLYSGDFKCSGERIEKNGSTWGVYRSDGYVFRIEKSGYTIAFVKSRGSKWAIEDTGSNTLAWLNGSNIEHVNGSSWTSLSTAKSFCEAPDQIAAAIWVLSQLGKL
ncbi:MAG TPA: hypothetical protein PLE16_03655 [Spirochaetota bacterium]|nr:hypothetical protein [Spirochaetota bacterium]HOH36947.1 hypothetical protein [Spirochaetota bacterium]HPJ14534.1 hypothetical protein [Spirochaetota bacterium]HPM33678.1 hypothetical protein [Spirochaetota bacterium]HPY03056.1 hypothetical protein [Spirochaetota bacterium]